MRHCVFDIVSEATCFFLLLVSSSLLSDVTFRETFRQAF